MRLFTPIIAILLLSQLSIKLALAESTYDSHKYAELSAELSSDNLKNIAGNNSLIVFRNQRLGVVSLKIESLNPKTRETIIQSEAGQIAENRTLYLGKALVKVSRGIAASNNRSKTFKASISAKIDNDSDGQKYLKLNFLKPRKSGRVYEVIIPLNSKKANLRSVSLRALSGKTCNQDLAAVLPKTAQLNVATDVNKNLTTPATARASTTKVFTVATDCDFECYTKLGQSQANDRILEFINAASNYYENDFSYSFEVTSQVARSDTTLYPTNTTDSERLLNLFTSVAPSLKSADLKHLITGKSMDKFIVGLSYVGVVCAEPQYSVGFSEHLSTLLTPLVLAHEIGHNFNAMHDPARPAQQGIMTEVLSSPYPTSFSDYSKAQITGFINSLGRLACYSDEQTSSSSSSSSTSSSSSSSGGSGSTVGGQLSASFTTRFAKSRFTSSISQKGGSSCTVRLRAATSESALMTASTEIFSSSIGLSGINLLAMGLPKVKVSQAGKKALVWFNVQSTCSEGSAISSTRKINLAIAPANARGKRTFRNVKAWISQLKQSVIAY